MDLRVRMLGVLGVSPLGSRSWGAGNLASPGHPGTRPVPGGLRLPQSVSASLVVWLS